MIAFIAKMLCSAACYFRRLVRACLVAVIRFWQICCSPWLGDNCRFSPSCSEYAKQALEQHGIVKGLWYSVARIARCNSLSAGGFDPLVEKKENISITQTSLGESREL